MSTLYDVQAVGKEIEKIVNGLIQAEKSIKNSVKSAKSLSSGSVNGAPAASFGGLSDQTKAVLNKYSAAGGGGTGVMATSLGVITAGIGAMWNSVPGVDDAYKYKSEIFNTSFAASGRFNSPSVFGSVKASFGSGFDATGVNAASMMTNAGIGPASSRFGSTMNQAGFLSSFSGRSNESTTAGMISLQQGSQGVVGNLASFGIFVTDPKTGKSGGLQSIVDQIWLRWYGSSTAKVDPIQFEADLMGGWVGSDMSTLFGGNPELYQNVLDALRIKVKAGGRSVSYSNKARGKNSASGVVSGAGVRTEDQPWGTRQKLEQGRMENIADASDALIQGFQDAAVVIDTFNKSMNAIINSPFGQLGMRTKGATDSLMGSQELGGLGGFLGGLAGSFGARVLAGGGSLLGAAKNIFTRNPKVVPFNRSGSTSAPSATTGLRGIKGGIIATGAAAIAGMVMPEGPVKDLMFGAPVGTTTTTSDGSTMTRTGDGTWIRTLPGHGTFGEGSGSTFGSGQGGSLPRDTSSAMSWAAASQSMTGQFDGLCDRYVANVYGLAHSGYETARAHWQAIPDEYKYPGDKNPPVGALVFWNVGNSGHVAVVVSSGPTVSTTHVGGTPTQMSLEECTRQLGGWGTYYGWSKPYFGGDSADVGGAASSEASATSAAISRTNYIQPSTGGSDILGNPNAMTSGLSAGGILSSLGNPIMGGDANSTSSPGTSANPTSIGGSSLGGATKSVVGSKGLIGVLQKAGFKGQHLREAYAIAMRESSGHANSHNTNKATGDNSYGLFQINMLGKLGPDRDSKFRKHVPGYNGPESLFDPEVNARAAAYMSQRGKNWGSWVSPTYGRAAEYYASYPGASSGMMLSRDQLVNAHAGEMIVPAYQTTQLKELLQGGINGLKGTTNVTINVNVPSVSREEATKFAKWVKQDMESDSVIDRLRSR